MRYSLTLHARKSLEERVIPLEWLERALNTPDRIDPDRDDPLVTHYLKRIPEHSNRVLRVAVNATQDPAAIVTIYFDRSLRNRL